MVDYEILSWRALGLLLILLAGAALADDSPAPGPLSPRKLPPKSTVPAAPAAVRQDSAPIELNEASARDLERLPRIGPALAARILASRREEGPFPSVDSLTRVRGIGPRTVDRVRPWVRVSAEPTPGEGPSVNPSTPAPASAQPR